MNQRILEDLQLKKQLLQASTASSVVIPQVKTTNNPLAQKPFKSTLLFQYMQMSVSEPSVAPVSTTNQSFGYFIPQDSAFGNTILPVLPRYEAK